MQAKTVREFVHVITAQAKAALANVEQPGFLQLTRLHPTEEELIPYRFHIDDTDGIFNAALADNVNGHNTYIEGRTVKPGLRGKQRVIGRHSRRVRPRGRLGCR